MSEGTMNRELTEIERAAGLAIWRSVVEIVAEFEDIPELGVAILGLSIGVLRSLNPEANPVAAMKAVAKVTEVTGLMIGEGYRIGVEKGDEIVKHCKTNAENPSNSNDPRK